MLIADLTWAIVTLFGCLAEKSRLTVGLPFVVTVMDTMIVREREEGEREMLVETHWPR